MVTWRREAVQKQVNSHVTPTHGTSFHASPLCFLSPTTSRGQKSIECLPYIRSISVSSTVVLTYTIPSITMSDTGEDDEHIRSFYHARRVSTEGSVRVIFGESHRRALEILMALGGERHGSCSADDQTAYFSCMMLFKALPQSLNPNSLIPSNAELDEMLKKSPEWGSFLSEACSSIRVQLSKVKTKLETCLPRDETMFSVIAKSYESLLEDADQWAEVMMNISGIGMNDRYKFQVMPDNPSNRTEEAIAVTREIDDISSEVLRLKRLSSLHKAHSVMIGERCEAAGYTMLPDSTLADQKATLLKEKKRLEASVAESESHIRALLQRMSEITTDTLLTSGIVFPANEPEVDHWIKPEPGAKIRCDDFLTKMISLHPTPYKQKASESSGS